MVFIHKSYRGIELGEEFARNFGDSICCIIDSVPVQIEEIAVHADFVSLGRELFCYSLIHMPTWWAKINDKALHKN